MQQTKKMEQKISDTNNALPTKKNPIIQREKVETWKDGDGIRFARNLNPKDQDYTWLHSVSKSCYTLKTMRQRITGNTPIEQLEAGFISEPQTIDRYVPILAQAVKQPDGNWKTQEIRLRSFHELRELLRVLDSDVYQRVHSVFAPTCARCKA